MIYSHKWPSIKTMLLLLVVHQRLYIWRVSDLSVGLVNYIAEYMRQKTLAQPEKCSIYLCIQGPETPLESFYLKQYILRPFLNLLHECHLLKSLILQKYKN